MIRVILLSLLLIVPVFGQYQSGDFVAIRMERSRAQDLLSGRECFPSMLIDQENGVDLVTLHLKRDGSDTHVGITASLMIALGNIIHSTTIPEDQPIPDGWQHSYFVGLPGTKRGRVISKIGRLIEFCHEIEQKRNKIALDN